MRRRSVGEGWWRLATTKKVKGKSLNRKVKGKTNGGEEETKDK